jgi:hypothetical protein
MSTRRKLPNILKGIDQLPNIESRYISAVPFCLLACGSIKSGKSYIACSLISLMKKERSITHLHIISPTASSNNIYKAIINPEVDRLYEDLSPAVYDSIRQIEKDIAGSAEQYARDLQYAISYKRFVDAEPITIADEVALEERGYVPLTYVRRASHCLLIDDAQNSAIFSKSAKNPFSNFCLRLRHLSQIGCSIIFCTQTFCGGVPRCLRNGSLTHLAVFATQSTKEQRSIYEECGGLLDWEMFQMIFREYTVQPHSYMWIDLVNKRIEQSF